MTTQRDPSPCCNVRMVTFSSGGGTQITGPYVMCPDCRKAYTIDYKTGVLKDE